MTSRQTEMIGSMTGYRAAYSLTAVLDESFFFDHHLLTHPVT